MNEYIKFIESTRKLKVGSYEDKVERLLSLSGETGELLELYKKEVRDKTPIDRIELISELGDVLYSICAIISMERLTIQQVVEFNIGKLNARRAQINES